MFGFGGKSFDVTKDIPDCSNKTILITGGNIGLGLASIEAIAPHNPAHIYLAARSEEKANAAIADIKRISPKVNISFLECDLSSLASVEKAAKEFLSKSERLDILFCNAGIMAIPPSLSKDGYEAQFGTNHVGHALLIKLLLPTLLKTAEEPAADVRIIALSSLGHNYTPPGGIAFSTLKSEQAEYITWARYGQSKLANILYAKELAKRYPSIKSIPVHPGVVQTNLSTTFVGGSIIYKIGLFFLSKIPYLMKSPADGALNQLWAAFSDEAKSGEYYEPIAVAGKASQNALNEKLAADLWDWTEKELASYKVEEFSKAML